MRTFCISEDFEPIKGLTQDATWLCAETLQLNHKIAFDEVAYMQKKRRLTRGNHSTCLWKVYSSLSRIKADAA